MLIEMAQKNNYEALEELIRRIQKDIYAIFVMLLKNSLYKNERSYKKIQDVISSIGGIYQGITIVAYYINALYNKFIVLSDTEVLIKGA